MAVLNARRLRNETSAILNEVAKGKTFQIIRNGKLIGSLQPVEKTVASRWKSIMAKVWTAQRDAAGTTPNPVLAERKRRRR